MRWGTRLLLGVCLLVTGCGTRGTDIHESTRVLGAAPGAQVADVQAAAAPAPAQAQAAKPEVPAGVLAPRATSRVRPVPPRPTIQTLAFCPRESYTPLMDLHRPVLSGPAPVVVFVHGGAFISGTRREGLLLDALLPALVARGFAVASIEYRLAPRYPWPSQIEDVKCAVRFLRAQGAELGLDISRIGAWGESAGGHLVAMLAGSGGLFETGPHLDRSSQVQAVLDIAGPADLSAADWPRESVEWIRMVFGSDHDGLRNASPISHVSRDVPFMLVHGNRDEIVPYAQSLAFAQKLRMVGASVTLLTAEGAGHDPRFAPGMRPSLPEMVSIAVDFFVTRLAVD